MPIRKIPLVKNSFYHIYNKSIAEFRIFNSQPEYERIINTMFYYNNSEVDCKFSMADMNAIDIALDNGHRLVDIICYCIMPTHFHLILKENVDGGITTFVSLVCKSYSHYFNTKHNRRGPLWEGCFKNVLIESDYQLLHLSRYIHLNPVTAFLVNDPIKWKYSSYNEYTGSTLKNTHLCNFKEYIDIEKTRYEVFVKDQIPYQRELAFMKKICIE